MQIRSYSSASSNFSSRRVPDWLISIAGQILRSTMRRSRMISMLPVPLNSSKITSSILLPVSTSAVARMVNDPPSSIFLADPKKAFGFCIALASSPPESVFPDCGHSEFQALPSRVMESRKITTSTPLSTKRFAFSSTISAT